MRDWLSRTWISEFISHSTFVFVQSVQLLKNHQIQSANWIKTFDCTFNLKHFVNQAYRSLSFSVMTLVDHFQRLKGFSFSGSSKNWSVHCDDSFVFRSQELINFSITSCPKNLFCVAGSKLSAWQIVFRRKQQLSATLPGIHAQNPLVRA